MSISAPVMKKLMILPAALFLLVLFYTPLAKIVGMSVNAPDISTVHYDRFFSSASTLRIGQRTFVYSAMVTIICLLLGYPMAAFISRMVKEGRNYILICVIIPYLTSLLVRTYAWMILLSDNGLINSFLLGTGIVGRPLSLLYTTFGAMIGMVHLMLPIMILPIYAVIHGLNHEQMRAASSLGGGPLRSFFAVYLPQTLPGVRAGCILVFAISLGFYITPAALGGLRDMMLANIIAKLVNETLDFAFASTISIALLVMTIAVYVVAGGGGVGGLVTEQEDKPRRKRNIGSLLAALARSVDNSRPMAWLQKLLWERNMGRRASRSPLLGLPRYLFCGLLLVFLLLPSVVVVIMSFTGDDTLGFPPRSWSFRWYGTFFANEIMTNAAVASFRIAIGNAILALVIGIPASYALVRGNLRGSQILYVLILAPIIVPPIVTAVGTYKVFADWGIIGSGEGVMLSHVPGSLAYVVIIMCGTFMGLDPKLELASLSLGASHLRTMLRITLPLVLPGVLAGGIFAFIYSFDEIVLTSFIAGVGVQTLPQQIWLIIQHQLDPQIAAISALMMILPIIALPFFRRR